MANTRIMDAGAIGDDKYALSRIKENMGILWASMHSIITHFESDPSVESFFVSGNFGQAQKERVENLWDGLDKYCRSLFDDGELIDLTNQFLEAQRNRIESGQPE